MVVFCESVESGHNSRRLTVPASPYEGYTPVDMCVRAMLIDRDYPGWVSIETFCESMREPEEGVPEEHARRGMSSWKKLVGALSDVAT